MIVKLLTEHHLEFLSFKGGCRGSSESTHVKMPHCWKSHAAAQILESVSVLPAQYNQIHQDHRIVFLEFDKKKNNDFVEF